MAESIMLNKSKDFAESIIIICRELKANKHESVITNQLLRSGTSIGANIHESKYAQSNADFISKMQIALKECYESEYWLELLNRTQYISDQQYSVLKNACGQIRRMLISSINTSKEKKQNNQLCKVLFNKHTTQDTKICRRFSPADFFF